MIFKQIDAHEKRKKLKADLKSGLRFVGSFSPLVSQLLEQKGFEGIYISGAMLSSFYGRPDIGLMSLKEVADQAEQIVQSSSLPSIVDADTGFGGAVHCAQTVYELEKRGLSACHIEDQSFPKRCGHLDQKSLISTKDMCLKIQSAIKARTDSNFLIIARTDARGVEGLDQAIDRAKEYVLAGADVIFPEALKDIKEFDIFRSKIKVPLMANMTEFGKTEIIPYKQFKKIGYNIVIYPVSLWRIALKAVDQGLDVLLKDQQKDLLPQMQTRHELYKLLKYKDYSQFDKDIYNFSFKKDKS